ncbi:helix-turn-helix domain-containing protein [Erysipelothrix amsterdamensis]|uniref:Helix-turn-helix domain-containing protein n=1 Tax=Erysipelothrix amsterdamensis TaxID=2929157 RepID=A0AAU9VHC2_9FIRM|nr:leucine zipper domain-containing protein [Erysipelothrix rhusiopathiae]MDE8227674.1 leucine zipper domain-containing protein [Erysipelothrix rhusiopathiae]CAH2762293.1 helix-turn-helix domain-containing protein [Erysipelothrix sp. A18Y020d]CAH2762322.1 helix-turn-helix domain-containing protein [Erysipelothrix sp. A18Y020d]
MMGRPKGGLNNKWTYEDRIKVVTRHIDEHISAAKLSQETGIPKGTINGWIDRFMRDGNEGLKNKKKTGNHFSALHTSKSLTEIERLQLEILKRDIEIARLKKGYQVKGVGVNKEFVTLKDKNSK